MNSISVKQHDAALCAISEYKSNLARKIQNGETQESFAIGAQSFTQKEWGQLLERVDKDIDEIIEEQEIRQEKLQEERLVKELYENMNAQTTCKGQKLMERMSGEQKEVPYAYLAKDGIIAYNGVTFVCDEKRHAICLGNVEDKKNVLTIPLEEGGSLMVNRDNLEELGKAMGMFSPEDKKRILWAIATDEKCKRTEEEIEEEQNSIGDSAEERIDE